MIHSNEFSVADVLTTGGKGCLIFVEKLVKGLVSFVGNITFWQHTSPYFLDVTW